ncbi:TetR/AcrR family transcriptional regulator [Archangium lansingense]|uniref:TetR/AcrR family transcriptional regulator n=1 Tax=Archangium lansingense TaxID=2995310 RepID=A0ABT4A886_9BACT|nr:TetR/AcrR family transcriptional regulator [Archangium lansinium]MCY1077830.1 TetR/AcrR family transcriptional regulator [Archangium lansinium]
MPDRQRGRPRSDQARRAILEATRELLAAHGYERLSVERIASEAGVGKQTVYRWWPSKSAVVAECLLEGYLLPEQTAVPDTGDVRADVRALLVGLTDYLGEPKNASLMRALVAAASDSQEVSDRLYKRFTAPYHAAVTERLRTAIRSGQLRAADPVPVADALIGFVVYRLLARTALSEEACEHLLDALFTGLAR